MKNYPSEDLVSSIEEIATIKDSLSLRDRSLTSGKGLYVQSGRLPTGAIQYMAGERFIAKLVFVKEPNGGKIVKKYQPGDWELEVEETLELCRTIKRASGGPQDWTPEKITAYEAEEAINVELLNKVAEVNRQHYNELNKQWQLKGLPHWIELRDKFLDELKKEWPTEYLELKTNQKGAREIAELLRENVTKAYAIGYMCGKGWISQEELTNAGLYLGDLLAIELRYDLKGAKSKGIAFATSLACISAIGHADAWKRQQD